MSHSDSGQFPSALSADWPGYHYRPAAIPGYRNAMTSLAPGIAMIAVFALTGGALHLLRLGEDRRRGWLMLGAALVLFGNVLIWTL